MEKLTGHDSERIRTAAVTMVILCIVGMAAGWSRMRPPAFLLVNCGDVLRWREALSMMFFAPLLVLVLWKIFLVASDNKLDAWTTAFVAGVYFLGLGMGMHDTCDLLGRIYRDASPQLRQSLDFFDNKLGHWVFFVGFVTASVAAGVQQLRHPLTGKMTWAQTALFLVLSTPMMLVMVTNLMYEKTGVDLCVIAGAIVLVVGGHCHWRINLRRLPILWVLYPAYTVAVVGTLLYWAMH